MSNIKNYLLMALCVVILIVTIAASAGSINFGAVPGNVEWFYIIVGILNLGWCYPVVRQFVKLANQLSVTAKPEAAGGAASPKKPVNKEEKEQAK